MDRDAIDGALAATLEDRRLSRGERHALRELFVELSPSQEQLDFVRHRAFALARDAIEGKGNREVLEWLEDVVKAIQPRATGGSAAGTSAEVRFSPGADCLDAIRRALAQARAHVDVCVFTITDDRVAKAMLDAHRRGVQLRVLTDEDKSRDRGSDVARLARAGLEVRVDGSRHHMHHKFAVFDARLVITGSYNWTRSAAEHNQENLLITDDPRFVRPYREAFDRLWDAMTPVGRG
ncbi:MAG: phospholipase D-like domain-containing protein [Myxococcota bacterium]